MTTYELELTDYEKGLIMQGLDLLTHDNVEQYRYYKIELGDKEGADEYWQDVKAIEKLRDKIRQSKKEV